MTATEIILLLLVAGLAAGLGLLLAQRKSGPAPAPQVDRAEEERLLEHARTEAEQIRLDAQVQAKGLLLRAQEEADGEQRERRGELKREAERLTKLEEQLERKGSALTTQEEEQTRRERQVAAREQAAQQAARKAEESAAEIRAQLEKIAALTTEQAQKRLADEVRDEARRQAAVDLKRIEEDTRAQAEDRARTIIGTAIQRLASEYVAERTVSVVPLPSDDMKGRIIGREGRNIRALEAATGIDLIIDDTPEAVFVSCFNPVRREIARLTLTRLLADGRIHPSRIEEVVERCTEEVEQHCKEAGEQAVYDLGLAKIHPDLVRTLGKLKFRQTQAQNLLQHSIEVAWLAGAMAAELGVNVKLARRAGLLHDVGRALDQEAEGSHAMAGAQLCKRLGEHQRIVDAVAAHHGETPPQTVLEHLVDAANVLSSQRPGARRDLLESYIQRLHTLEKVCTTVPGVEKAFAIQAGREVRVFVHNDRVSDEQLVLLSRDIARRIEDETTYAGQVKVCVVRETRSTDYAK